MTSRPFTPSPSWRPGATSSSRPNQPRSDISAIAGASATLMTDVLGYSRFTALAAIPIRAAGRDATGQGLRPRGINAVPSGSLDPW